MSFRKNYPIITLKSVHWSRTRRVWGDFSHKVMHIEFIEMIQKPKRLHDSFLIYEKSTLKTCAAHGCLTEKYFRSGFRIPIKHTSIMSNYLLGHKYASRKVHILPVRPSAMTDCLLQSKLQIFIVTVKTKI